MSNNINGYNPLRWDCSKHGCFNLKCRPKIEMFADCFPRRINFGDVDGQVELNGNCLQLEWKTKNKNIPTGQKRAFISLSKDNKVSVIVVLGNAQTMEVSAFCKFYKGKQSPWQSGNLDTLKETIKKWVNLAEGF